jgi:glycosyltransferase involved in cell wall biosynthesis
MLSPVERQVTEDKRLLFVTFDFPPRRTSSVYRMRSLAKYLSSCGWNPTVLTVRGPVALWDAGELIHDERLLDGLPPDIEIVRTGYLDLQAWEGIHPQHTLNRRPANARSAEPIVAAKRSLVARIVLAPARSTARIIRSILYFPDRSAGWIPYALFAAIKLQRTHRFKAVFTSSPPRASLIVGMLFKFLFRVPWTADFMDPWYDPPGTIRRRSEKWLLRRILRHADRVVVVTDGHAAALREEFGADADHVEVIANGFDEDNFRDLSETVPPVKPFVSMLHVGTVYPGFSGRFFDALAELIGESPEIATKLHIDIIGVADSVTAEFSNSPLGQQLMTVHGYRPQTEALAAMFRTDYLLLFLADEAFARQAVSGKMYEYMRVGRPILALTYPGGVQKLIDQSGSGLVLRPDDVATMKDTLRRIIVERSTPQPDWREFADQFRYDRLAVKLSRVLDDSRRAADTRPQDPQQDG